MRKALLFVALVGFLAGGAAAAPLSLCDYVSQESNIRHLSVSLAYRYYNDLAVSDSEVSGGRAALDYDQVYDSPDVGFSLLGTGEATLDDLRPKDWLGQTSGTFRYYVSPEVPFFGFGGVDAALASGDLLPDVHVSVGVGYGRFTNVTPLAKALKIAGTLLASNAIPARLTDDTLLGLSRILGTKYASTKDQISDLVAQIQADASVTLDPRQVLRIEDIVTAAGDERDCGWVVQAGLGYQLVDPSGKAQDFLFTVSADAALATGPDGQLLLRATVSGPFNIADENTLTARASYDYLLSETSSLRATYTLQSVKPSGSPAAVSYAATLLLGFAVGRADLGVQLALSKPADHSVWTIDLSLSAVMSLI